MTIKTAIITNASPTIDLSHECSDKSAPLAGMASVGQGSRHILVALNKRGPLSAEELSKFMPEGYQSIRTLRGRLSELCQAGLVVVDHKSFNNRNRQVRVYRAATERGHMKSEGGASQAVTKTTSTTVEEGSQGLPPKDAMLAYLLEEERQFIESYSSQRGRCVNIEKIGQAWLCRFLPVGLGPRNLWYVRQGQHWLNKQPIVCPRCVSPDFGGDPNAFCAVCEMAKSLNAEKDEAISNFGSNLRARLGYLTFCLVFQIDPGRGEVQDMLDREILRPWEFVLEPSCFEELMDYFLRCMTNSRPYSVLDLEKGSDFWATRTTKGTRLDRQDPGPIFEQDANYEAKLNQIFNAITQPKIKIPTLKELETFARKAEAAAYNVDGKEPKLP